MGDGDTRDGWARYLREMTSRPGWSVARLARESGIARQTIFAWMKEGGGSLTIASVKAVAKALDADMAQAMLAAGDVLGPPNTDNDGEMAAIVHSDLSATRKDWYIALVRARRAKDLEFTREMIDREMGTG